MLRKKKVSPRREMQEAANGDVNDPHAWIALARKCLTYTVEQIIEGDIDEAKYMINTMWLYLLKFRHKHGYVPLTSFPLQWGTKDEVLTYLVKKLVVFAEEKYQKASGVFWANLHGLSLLFDPHSARVFTNACWLRSQSRVLLSDWLQNKPMYCFD